MSLYIISYNHRALRNKSTKVPEVDRHVRYIMNTMERLVQETCPTSFGLAAPQIGINKRIIIVKTNNGILKLANPEIIKYSGRQIFLEGCISVDLKSEYNVGTNLVFPRGFEERAAYIEAKGLNYDGELIKIGLEGIEAQIFQHEVDHLDGILFTDKTKGELIPCKSLKEVDDLREKNPIKVLVPPMK